MRDEGGRGRPAKDHRLVVNAVLWRLATGAPWRDLPALRLVADRILWFLPLATGWGLGTGPGRPRQRPDRVAGAEGYTGRPIRTDLRRRGIGTSG